MIATISDGMTCIILEYRQKLKATKDNDQCLERTYSVLSKKCVKLPVDMGDTNDYISYLLQP